MRIASLTQESNQIKAPNETATENGAKLWRAARSGQLPRVQRLLKLGADVSYRCNEYGTTALHQAAGNSHKDVLEALLEAGSNVDDEDIKGSTALHYATSASVVEALIMAGADVDHEDREGKTPGRIALDCNNMAVVGALVSERADPSKIYEPRRSTDSSRRVTLGKQEEDIGGRIPILAAQLSDMDLRRTAGDNNRSSLTTPVIQTTERPTLTFGGSDQKHKLIIGIVSVSGAYIYTGHLRHTLGNWISMENSSFLRRGI
jgi:ankyrin repeat protein